MTSRVSSKKKEKKAKRKNSVKKRDQTKKKRYKEIENGVAESRTRFICTTHDLKINFVISKQFFSAIDAV